MGQYSEKLNSGGEFIVTEKDWRIEYYFLGPDLRYNGTRFSIPGMKIDRYITAWQNNFKKYLQLKSTFSLDGSYETIGEEGMRICVGGCREGVCIDGWHMNLNTQKKINEIVADYQKCKSKATTIQSMLKSL